MYQSENLNELMSALSKAQGEIISAAKDSNNPYFSSKYADLSSVWSACRQPLSKNGLSIIQTMNKENDELYLVTTLGHASGQWMKSYLPIKVQLPKDGELNKSGNVKKANEVQILGSCITYLRRYALSAIVGVAPDEDDDGNEAGKYYKSKPQHEHRQELNESKKEVLKCSKSDAKQLSSLISECSPSYQNRVKNFLTTQNLSSLDNLSIDTYQRMKEAATRDKKEYADQIKQDLELQLSKSELAEVIDESA